MRQVDENYSPVQLEKETRALWDRTRAYEKVKKSGESGKAYYFLDGPPYTTGSIHIGTAWNKILKDTMIRYRRMQGLNVRDQPGYDMHGLPIEVKVEQSLGFKTKKDIERYGIDKFVGTCREFALKFKTKMTEEFKALGIWMDWDNPYLTVDPSYVASVWWTLKQAYDKNLLTMDHRVLPWCPRCETALAEAEIEYWDETDPSIYVKFPLEGKANEYLLVWTTTPWTIPGNLAVAVHPDLQYARVRIKRGQTEEVLILLAEKIEELKKIADIDDVKILGTMKGAEMTGLYYRHPLADLVPYQDKVRGDAVHAVLAADSVTTESTGVVHVAPGHGPEDFEIGKAVGLEPYSPVDETGAYTEAAGEHFAGKNVRDANPVVIKDLVERGALFHEAAVTHRYGHCWRCKKPVIYRITDQWFLRVSEFKDQLESANAGVRWYPEWAGSSREKDWIANARDWCISRQRYWGTPLPIWKCDQCGNVRLVSSLEELGTAKGWKDGMDVHRPWIDSLTFECDKCKKEMKRVPDVLDVWFDAGVCSWASLGYPAGKEQFDKWWPAEWITEAHDQTRGWFYSQLVTGVVAFGKSPYKSVMMHGWALTPQGAAMSKSEGTAIDPIGVVNTLGADSLRFYLLKANSPWEDMAFQQEGVKGANRTLNILWNVYKFATLYMSIDKFEYAGTRLESIRGNLRADDLWMLSRIETLKKTTTDALEVYELHKAARAIEEFIVSDLSRWYVKLVRDRLWKEGEDKDKLAAFRVLHEALSTAVALLAPITPHISESIHQNLTGRPETVHLMSWPAQNPAWIDAKLEEGMNVVREISEIVARIRQQANINLRWPLKKIIIKVQSEDAVAGLNSLKEALLSQNNIKELLIVPVGEEWDEMILSVVPNPNAIGKVYRQWSSKIAVLLKNRPAKTIKAGIDKGEYSLGIEGQLVKILPNMVSFTSTLPPDVVGAEFSKGSVYVDLEQTPALEAEGFSREMIRRIQQMRKDMKLDVEEFIKVELQCSRRVEEFLETWKDKVTRETRAKQFDLVDGPKGDYVVEWSVETESLVIGVSSLKTRAPPAEPAKAQAAATVKTEMPSAPVQVVTPPEAPVSTPSQATPERAVAGARPAEPVIVERQVVGAPVPAAPVETVPRTSPEQTVIQSTSSVGVGVVENVATPQPAAVPSASAVPRHEPEGAKLVPPSAVVSLEKSFSYLVEEERPETSYKLFMGAMEKGLRGFCITRNYPAKIRSKFDLKETPVVWLSNVGRENAIRPKDLEKLSLSLEQFLSQSGGGIVLLDGLEYLITNNNFITVLRLIQSLRDQVAINQSILLMAVNRSTLESHQLNLLEREVDYTITG